MSNAEQPALAAEDDAAAAPLASPTFATADRFGVVLPGDWMVLPMDRDQSVRDRRIAGLVRKEFGTDDRYATNRRMKIIKLRKAVTEAVQNGGFFGAIQGRLLGEAALAASFMASKHPTLKGPEGNPLTDAAAIGTSLAARRSQEREVSESSTVELMLGPAARLRMRAKSGIEAEGNRPVPAEALHFYVPLPEADRTVVMVFSTPLLPLADAYIELFDLIAGSARWMRSRTKGWDGVQEPPETRERQEASQ